MSNSEDPHPDATDPLAQLLAKAGARRAPPKRLEAEVRAAVHAEWQHLVAGRKARLQRRWLAAVGFMICALGTTWLVSRQLSTGTAVNTPQLIATAQQARDTTVNGSGAANESRIHDGDTLRTGNGGAVRLALNNGIDVRIAGNSELRWINANEVQLTQGSMYVDSHSNAAALTVHTVRGDVTHLGTRYRIDADGQMLRVAVREGQAAIKAGAAQFTVAPLEQLQLDAQSQAIRSELRMDDASWQWVDALAQPFALENRSVSEFLKWVGDETGYQLSYASAAIKTNADRVILHGQQTTLPPLQALQVVLAATDFHATVQDRQLLISQAQ
ncbi:MAG: FecR family protein [Steroidobacteraceae bacterium]